MATTQQSIVIANPTTGVVVDSRSFQQRFLSNLDSKLKSGSFWVVTVGGSLLAIASAIWGQTNAAQQNALVGALGVSDAWKPLLLMIVPYVVAALRPTNTLSAQTTSILNELAQRKLNEHLVAAGQPPLPVQESALTSHIQVISMPTSVAAPADVAAILSPVPTTIVAPTAVSSLPDPIPAPAPPPIVAPAPPMPATAVVSGPKIVSAAPASLGDQIIASVQAKFPNMSAETIAAAVKDAGTASAAVATQRANPFSR